MWDPPGLTYRPDVRSSDARWLSGTELSEIVTAHDIQRFRHFFPEAVDLSEHNQEVSSRGNGAA
jgi:hypothetical protein